MNAHAPNVAQASAARDDLRAAHAVRAAAEQHLDLASRRAERSQAVLDDAERSVAAHGDVDAAVAAHHAAEYRAWAERGGEGERPALQTPSALVERRASLADARSRHAAARDAHASLALSATRPSGLWIRQRPRPCGMQGGDGGRGRSPGSGAGRRTVPGTSVAGSVARARGVLRHGQGRDLGDWQDSAERGRAGARHQATRPQSNASRHGVLLGPPGRRRVQAPDGGCCEAGATRRRACK